MANTESQHESSAGPEEEQGELNPAFAATEAGLNICWQFALPTFGFSILAIGAYYLVVYVFRAHLENWCLPGEESAFPLFGFLSSSMRKMGIRNTPESWITICFILVLSACAVYAALIAMAFVLFSIMATCLNVANWWIGGTGWTECTKLF